ncbi:MAG: glycosyltransferase family 4 protein [Planctomycetes bacterium]|nr:glycosyltransferase family 4 protein [Planctomycetota bacterium]
MISGTIAPRVAIPECADPAREGGVRIGVITRSANGYGGTEVQLLQMVERWRAEGHRVVGLAGASRWGGPAAQGFRTLPGRAFLFPWACVGEVERHLRDVDAVFLNGASLSSLVWGRALRRMGKPILTDVSGLRGFETGSFGRWPWPVRPWLRQRARSLGTYRAMTTYMRQRLEEDGIDSADVILIPLGVDLERFRPLEGGMLGERRDALGVGGHPLAVYAGRLSPEKGLEEALTAWRRVIGVKPRAQWWILGEGPAQGRLRRVVRSLGLEGAVRFHGRTDDVAGILGAADLMILPSRSEGCPNAILESFACGVPVIARRIPALRDLIGRNERGLLVPDLSAEALGEAIVGLLDRSDLRSKMSRAARAYVEAHHDIEAASGKVLAWLVSSTRGERGAA